MITDNICIYDNISPQINILNLVTPIQIHSSSCVRSLKTRFREHFRKMKKPKKFDTFLYRHFKTKIMVIHLVKLKFSLLKKLYMILIHQLD